MTRLSSIHAANRLCAQSVCQSILVSLLAPATLTCRVWDHINYFSSANNSGNSEDVPRDQTGEEAVTSSPLLGQRIVKTRLFHHARFIDRVFVKVSTSS